MLLPATWGEVPDNTETRAHLARNLNVTLRKLMAGDGVTVMGFCGYYIEDNVFWLTSDYVFPQFRRRGLHLQMIQIRLTLARKSGCSVARARAYDDSMRNYVRAGFTVLNRYPRSALVELPL